MSTARQRVADYLLLLVGLSAGAGAVWALRQMWERSSAGSTFWLLLVGAGLLGGYALRRMERWLPETRPQARPVECPSQRRQRRGLALLMVAAALSGWVVWKLWPAYQNWSGTFWPWAAAIGLAAIGGGVLGCLGEPAADELPSVTQVDRSARWPRIVGFVLIAALAVFFRTYRIDTIPGALFGDETQGGLKAIEIIERGDVSPFATGWAQVPNGYCYYMAGLLKLFGATHVMLKAASIIPAVLTVLAIYPLGRLLFGPLTAWCAMALLAVSRWHVTMSRWGWIEVTPPLFQVVATFFLIRGLRERRALDFALGGLVSGVMMYTYLSCRLVLATLGLFALYWVALDPDGPRAGLRRHWRGLAIFALTWAVVFAPLAVTYIRDPNTFSERVSGLNIFNEVKAKHTYAPLWYSIGRHLRAFHEVGDTNGRHNLPGEPQLDPVTGLLFVIGLGYGLLRLTDRRRGLLWMWLGIGMAGGIFSSSHEAPQAFRSLTAVPAITLLAGDVLARTGRGMAWLWTDGAGAAAARQPRTWAAVLGGVIVAAGLAGSIAWEGTVYFGRQAESVSVRSAFHFAPTRAAQEIIDALNEEKAVYLSPPFSYLDIVHFLVYGAMREKLGHNTITAPPFTEIRPEAQLPIPDPGRDALFILAESDWPMRDYILAFYPHAAVDLVKGPVSPPNLYVRVRIAKEDFAAAQGLTARVTHADGNIIETKVATIDQEWQPTDLLAAQWGGAIRMPRSGVYSFSSDGDLSLLIDGQPWTGPRFLGSGLHSLQVTQTASQAHQVARLRWEVPGAEAAVIPASAFFRTQPPVQGLTGYHYANPNWEGPPVFKQTTPFFSLFWPDGEPFPAPFSIRYVGALRIAVPGPYQFQIEADDGARLLIDGQLVGEGLVPYQANRVQGARDMSRGEHRIELDYFQMGGASGLHFYWSPPDRPQEIVPPGVLIPEAP